MLTCSCAVGGAEIQTADDFAAGTAGEPTDRTYAKAPGAAGGMPTRPSPP